MLLHTLNQSSYARALCSCTQNRAGPRVGPPAFEVFSKEGLQQANAGAAGGHTQNLRGQGHCCQVCVRKIPLCM